MYHPAGGQVRAAEVWRYANVYVQLNPSRRGGTKKARCRFGDAARVGHVEHRDQCVCNLDLSAEYP